MKLMSAVMLAAVVALPAISASAVNAREIERYEYKDTRVLPGAEGSGQDRHRYAR